MSTMLDKQFDQHLNEVLQQLEVPYEPGTWAMLEQRMNAPVAEELPPAVDPVDTAVYHALDRLEAPFQAAHWDLMAQRLQQQSIRLRRLRVAKFAEAAIFLLLLANIGFLYNKDNWDFLRAPSPARPNVPVAQAGAGKASGKSARRHQAPAEQAWLQTAIASTLSGEGTTSVLSMDYRTAPQVSTVLGNLDALAAQARQRVFAAAELLPADALQLPTAPSRELLFAKFPTQPFRSSKPVYIAAYTGADQNLVLVGKDRRASGGYSAGFSVGVRKGKWGLETGLGYSQKNYIPEKFTEIYAGGLSTGYYGSSLTEVNSDLVTVPVKVSRRIAQMGKTSAHAVLGVTANIATSKGYDYRTVYYPGQAPSNHPTQDPNTNPLLRESGRGALESGGSLSGNVYASVDAGVRIERRLANSRYVAFVEPSFRQSLNGKGIGPKREPINTFSVQAGVMAFL